VGDIYITDPLPVKLNPGTTNIKRCYELKISYSFSCLRSIPTIQVSLRLSIKYTADYLNILSFYCSIFNKTLVLITRIKLFM